MGPRKVVTFPKDQEIYELEVASRRAALPKITATPYLASIDQELLGNLIFKSDLDEIAPDATLKTLHEEQV